MKSRKTPKSPTPVKISTPPRQSALRMSPTGPSAAAAKPTRNAKPAGRHT